MKLKEKLIIYYLSATFLILLLVGFVVLNAIKSLSINTLEQQLINQSSLAELYISQLHAIQNQSSDQLSDKTSQFVIGKLGLVLGNIRIYDRDLRLLASSKDNDAMGISDTENKEILSAAAKENYAYLVEKALFFLRHQSPLKAIQSVFWR